MDNDIFNTFVSGLNNVTKIEVIALNKRKKRDVCNVPDFLNLTAEQVDAIKTCYKTIKHVSKKQNVECFSFNEWLQCWIDAGHLRKQGHGVGHYSLRRIDPSKGFTADNVWFREQKKKPCYMLPKPVFGKLKQLGVDAAGRKRMYSSYKVMAQATYRKFVESMTFDEWVECWIKSGHLLEKASGVGKYKMFRYDTNKSFIASNIYIAKKRIEQAPK